MSKHEITGMSRLSRNDTGLPLAVMISDAPSNKKVPRIKVAQATTDFKNNSLNMSLSIAPHPEALTKIPKGMSHQDLASVAEWVSTNRSMLLKYWYGIETETRKVEQHLIDGKDQGKTFDQIIGRMRSMWVSQATKQEISTQMEVPVDAVDLIIDTNSKLFPDRK